MEGPKSKNEQAKYGFTSKRRIRSNIDKTKRNISFLVLEKEKAKREEEEEEKRRKKEGKKKIIGMEFEYGIV